MPRTPLSTRLKELLSGRSLILAIALITVPIVALLPSEEPQGISFWVMSKLHHRSYVPMVEAWNREHPEKRFGMLLINDRAFEQRMLSGFLSGTPVADLLELNTGVAPKAFLGPLEQVGFWDLTDRLHSEGLYTQFNAPSFAPFTSRGRIFGLPRGVHPVLLAYRADLVEATKIDVNEIETWEDYFRVMRPLMRDDNGDGRPDRYLLALSEQDSDLLTLLLLQNDGQIFDTAGRPVFASERNARTLATIVTWLSGPERRATSVPAYSSAGHRQRLDGLVVGSFVADWTVGLWKQENPRLAGRVKLMPLPAFERGGRRTSTWGGTMIGISKRATVESREAAWQLALHLYTSAELAEQYFRESGIISPLKAHWGLPVYQEDDPFCSGQSIGSMFIEQAPYIPEQPSSPYAENAGQAIVSVAIALRAYAERHDIYDAAALAPEALRLLAEAQSRLEKLISRNQW